ncbi:MAG: 6-bladed beta-propeller [Acidobacteriia bacterium]|nr:6-bladed beta-propeller [Terriglobia bacterium]
MKNLVFAIFGACVLVCGAFAQSSLFNRYDVTMKWGQLPAELPWDGVTSWVAADGKGQVIVMVRKAPYIRVFTTDGKFVKSWGEAPTFKEAHSVHFDHDGNMWGVDTGDHVVEKFDADGKVVMTLGKRGVTGDNASHDAFNRPATAFFAANGDIYVADGYVNARIVQFTKDGNFVRIIGGVKGKGPGEMSLVHGVAVDSKGRILASDSDNQRISVFGKDGNFVEWWSVPCRGNIVIAPDDTVYVSDVNAGGVTVMKEGKILDFIHLEGRPHGMSVDPSNGDVYTSSSDGKNPNVSKASLKKKPIGSN